MADISIPGVTDKYKTNDLIKNLMETERVPLKQEQNRLESYKTEQNAWRNVNAHMRSLRETVRSLYSFDNPFNSKLASSTDEYAVTAEPKRDAALESFKIEVLETAKADRFLSAELDSKMQVPAGTYEYTVNEKTISFNWKGGKLSDFAAALNRRSANTVKASLIGITKNTQALLIESLITGSENRLVFSKAAKDFALQTGMIGKAPAAAHNSFTIKRTEIQNAGTLNSKTVQFAPDALTLPPRSGFESAISSKIAAEKGNSIRFTVRAVDLPAEEILPDGPDLPGPGIVQFKDITLSNENLDTKLPEKTEVLPAEPIEDYTAVFIKTKAGGEIPLTALKQNGENTAYAVNISDYPDIQSLVIKNNNTHKKIIMSTPQTVNNSAAGGYIPLNPAETASDAKIKYQGITISRPTNEIEDVVPNVKLNIHAKTEKPATITIAPDTEAAKESLITFVGKYNRLVAEMNILTQTKPEIITELEYLSTEEAKEAEERLGMLQTEFTLINGKRSLQTIMANRHPSTDDAEITMLSQIGISSSATTGGFAGIAPSRLRGYLEIDEKKLDAALQSNMQDIKNLFGYDSDGDLLVDSGIAFLLDKDLQSFTQIGGIIASKTSLLNTRIGSSERNIESLEKKLKQKEQDLKRKYGQMEAVLNSLEKQSDSITNFTDSQNSSR
ncbi:flagellar filament capping protein FliD [Treponema sp. OMZ 840]|uniref:flagellar filament capping protein FliD n=1 Tax=Treponema sp. OMZ 840 TaxID=244313 RepID=UPI003D8B7AD2